MREWTDERLLNAIKAFREVPRGDLTNGERVAFGALLQEAHERRLTT